MKKVKKINYILFLLISIILFTSCSQIPSDLVKARKLAGKGDLESKMKAREIFIKYKDTDMGARGDLKLVNKTIGEIYYWDRNFKEALRFFRESLDIDPNQAVVHYYLGVCYANLYSSEIVNIRKDDYRDLTRFHYERAISLQPELEQAYYGLAMYYYKIDNDHFKALEILEKLLSINPEHIEALYVKRQIVYIDGDVQEALNITLEIQKILSSQKLQKNDTRPENIIKDIERLKKELEG